MYSKLTTSKTCGNALNDPKKRPAAVHWWRQIQPKQCSYTFKYPVLSLAPISGSVTLLLIYIKICISRYALLISVCREKQKEWGRNNICGTLTNNLGHPKFSFQYAICLQLWTVINNYSTTNIISVLFFLPIPVPVQCTYSVHNEDKTCSLMNSRIKRVE